MRLRSSNQGEGSRKNGPVGAPRVFEALKKNPTGSTTQSSKKYSGPQIHLDDFRANTESSEQSKPVYMDGQGKLYDRLYQQCGGTRKVAQFPSLEDYSSILDYKEAVLEWRQQTIKDLQGIKLPTILGRAYYRPRVVHQVFPPSAPLFSPICSALFFNVLFYHH